MKVGLEPQQVDSSISTAGCTTRQLPALQSREGAGVAAGVPGGEAG